MTLIMIQFLAIFLFGWCLSVEGMQAIGAVEASAPGIIYWYDQEDNKVDIKPFGKKIDGGYKLNDNGRKAIQCNLSLLNCIFGWKDRNSYQIDLDENDIDQSFNETKKISLYCLPAHASFLHLRDFINANDAKFFLPNNLKEDLLALFDTINIFEKKLWPWQRITLRKKSIFHLDKLLADYDLKKESMPAHLHVYLNDTNTLITDSYSNNRLCRNIIHVTSGVLSIVGALIITFQIHNPYTWTFAISVIYLHDQNKNALRNEQISINNVINKIKDIKQSK